MTFSHPRSFALLTAVFVTLVSPSLAHAENPMPSDECKITVGAPNYPCVPNYAGSVTGAISDIIPGVPVPYHGVRIDASSGGQSSIAIDMFGTCRFPDNQSGATSLFVPFKSKTDWDSYVSNSPTYATTVHCSRAFNPNNDPLPPSTWSLSGYQDAACTPQPVPAPNFYQRYGAVNPTYPVAPQNPPIVLGGCWNASATIEMTNVWRPLDADANNTNIIPGYPNYNTSWSPLTAYGPDIFLQATSQADPDNQKGVTLNLDAGKNLTLTWPASSAESCVASANPTDPNWTGPESVTGGVLSFLPTGSGDVTYTLTCVQNGLTSIANAVVNVSAIHIMYAAYHQGYHAPTFVAKSGALVCGNPQQGPSAGCLVNNTQKQTQGSAAMENAGYICAVAGYTYVACVGGTINDGTQDSPFIVYNSSLRTADGYIQGPTSWSHNQEGSNEYGHVSSVGCTNATVGPVTFTLTNNRGVNKNNLATCGWN